MLVLLFLLLTKLSQLSLLLLLFDACLHPGCQLIAVLARGFPGRGVQKVSAAAIEHDVRVRQRPHLAALGLAHVCVLWNALLWDKMISSFVVLINVGLAATITVSVILAVPSAVLIVMLIVAAAVIVSVVILAVASSVLIVVLIVAVIISVRIAGAFEINSLLPEAVLWLRCREFISL